MNDQPIFRSYYELKTQHIQETSMLSVGFEPAIPVSKQSQTYSLLKYLQEHLKYILLTCHLFCLEHIFEGNIVILVTIIQ